MAVKKVIKRNGRPPFVPTDRQRGMVAGMALWNVPMEKIRQRVLKPDGKPLDFKTFKKVFQKELEESLTNVETNLATAMYKRGIKGSYQDSQFILKCKFGWRDNTEIEDASDREFTIKGGLPNFLSIPEEAKPEDSEAEE